MHEMTAFVFYIGKGFGITTLLLMGSVLIGLSVGLIFAIASYQKKGVWIIKPWISLVRGTPMMLQLSLVYFVLPHILGFHLDIVLAGILAFGLNSSAYMGEIFRAGIESIPKGQFQAGQSLGVPTFYLWKDIIMPQVLQCIWPALINEVITLTKDTALISVLGGMDIMRRAQLISAEHFTYFMPLFIAAAYYYLFVSLLEWIFKGIVKKGGMYA